MLAGLAQYLVEQKKKSEENKMINKKCISAANSKRHAGGSGGIPLLQGPRACVAHGMTEKGKKELLLRKGKIEMLPSSFFFLSTSDARVRLCPRFYARARSEAQQVKLGTNDSVSSKVTVK